MTSAGHPAHNSSSLVLWTTLQYSGMLLKVKLLSPVYPFIYCDYVSFLSRNNYFKNLSQVLVVKFVKQAFRGETCYSVDQAGVVIV